MLIFPPYFLYIIFFIIDSISLVLYLTILLAPVAPVVDVLGTGLYIVINLMRYGGKKTSERLFSLKNRKSIAKKALKIFGGSLIPYVHIWAIYDDYKQDLQEAKNKKLQLEGGQAEVKKVSKLQNLVKTAAIVGAAVATDGASLAVEGAGAAEVAEGGTLATSAQAGESVAEEGASEPWITNGRPDIKAKKNKQTIAESLGEKTGLNRSDYEAELPNFGRYDTYQQLLAEKKKKEEEEREEKQAENERKRIQGLKTNENLHKEMFERSKRLFGKEANQTKMYKMRYRESLDEPDSEDADTEYEKAA